MVCKYLMNFMRPINHGSNNNNLVPLLLLLLPFLSSSLWQDVCVFLRATKSLQNTRGQRVWLETWRCFQSNNRRLAPTTSSPRCTTGTILPCRSIPSRRRRLAPRNKDNSNNNLPYLFSDDGDDEGGKTIKRVAKGSFFIYS